MVGQCIKNARKETEIVSHTIGYTSKTRPIDDTIGYLIKNNIQINYQGVRKYGRTNKHF